MVDLRTVVKKVNIPLYHRRFSDGHYLSISGPPSYRSQSRDCFATYELIRSRIREVTGRSCAFDVRLTIIALPEIPPNYVYTSGSFSGYQDCIVDVAQRTPLSKRLCTEGAHEMTHRAVRIVDKIVPEGNSLSEGLAMYMELKCLETLYPERFAERQRDYARAFLKLHVRAALWHWYNPAPYESKKFPGNSKEAVEAYWKPIDESYAASGGIYLYYERALVRERFLEMVHHLCATTHKAQDEAFYEDLRRFAGFDIRKVTEQEIRKAFNPILESQ